MHGVTQVGPRELALFNASPTDASFPSSFPSNANDAGSSASELQAAREAFFNYFKIYQKAVLMRLARVLNQDGCEVFPD
jgi:hypothetical protein